MLFGAKGIVDRLAELGRGQLAVTNLGSGAGTCDAAKCAAARYIRRGEGKGDQPDKAEGQEKPQFRRKDTAEKADHEREVPLREWDLALL